MKRLAGLVPARRLLLALILCFSAAKAWAATTWNPSDNSNLTLSNGNLTANDETTQSNWQSIRSTNSPGKTSGKWHIEFSASGSSGISGNWAIAFADSSEPLTNSNIGTSGTHALYFVLSGSNGQIHVFQNSVELNSYTLTWANGDVFAMEIDVTNALVWLQDVTQASGWTNSALTNFTGNPATGVGGTSITAASTGGIMALFSGFFLGTNVVICTVNPTTATTAVSSGFTIWDAGAANRNLLLLGVGQ